MMFGVAVAYMDRQIVDQDTRVLMRKLADRGGREEGGESIEGAGLARWDFPVTARGQLATTGQSDEWDRGRVRTKNEGNGGGTIRR